MAAPGYPQMGHMPPQMGGPPMGGPPMGAMPMPRPVRRGTSKAVPIVVSAGLAVGVFCGLLFGVGTGKENAAVSKGNNVKHEEESKPDPGAAPQGLGATAAAPVAPKQVTPPPAPAQPPPQPAKPEEKKVKLTVQIKPEAAAKDAKISIDGQEITGNSTEVPADKKTVKVEVKANGYRSAEKKIDLVGDELTLDIEMSKRSSSGGAPTVRPPKRIDKPPGPSNNGGGLIDI
jgi:hypothetical protein